MDQYITKLSRVSAACRLSPAEELLCVHQCRQVTPLIKTRLAYLDALAGRTPQPTAVLKREPVRCGGQPWAKLLQLRADYVQRTAAPLERMQYKRPKDGMLVGAALLATIWDDDVVMDEPSGANRQLGAALLYEVALGHVHAAFGAQGANASYADIMTRCAVLCV